MITNLLITNLFSLKNMSPLAFLSVYLSFVALPFACIWFAFALSNIFYYTNSPVRSFMCPGAPAGKPSNVSYPLALTVAVHIKRQNVRRQFATNMLCLSEASTLPIVCPFHKFQSQEESLSLCTSRKKGRSAPSHPATQKSCPMGVSLPSLCHLSTAEFNSQQTKGWCLTS